MLHQIYVLARDTCISSDACMHIHTMCTCMLAEGGSLASPAYVRGFAVRCTPPQVFEFPVLFQNGDALV